MLMTYAKEKIQEVERQTTGHGSIRAEVWGKKYNCKIVNVGMFLKMNKVE